MKHILTIFCCLNLAIAAFAQEKSDVGEKNEESIKTLQKFKVSGFIQALYQWGQKDAILKVGNTNTDPEQSFSRIGIRRGRIKFTYDDNNIASGIFQLDITEKGVAIKDAYIGIKDPWVGANSLRAGIMIPSFGDEISYSTSMLESIDHSTVVQALFPGKRDLGVALAFQAPESSPLNLLKLEAGLFAGNGARQETDNRRNFIGRFSGAKSINNSTKWGLGISYYNGGVYQGTENVYTMNENTFVLNSASGNIGKFAKREYLGFDGQFSIKSISGLSQVRVEYISGTQPGSHTSNKSISSSTLVITDTYIRNFSGGYITFIQDLGKLPFSGILKYDWYDANSKVSGNDVGLNGTGFADLNQSTLGFGIRWWASKSIYLQAYYAINNTEKTQNLAVNDIEKDIFTLCLQYKF